jgi:hypothetical protein
MPTQCAGAVLMVRPRHFGYNAETAGSNHFQAAPSGWGSSGLEHIAAQALAEFDALAAALRAEGVTVCVAEDSDQPRKPDAVFPNNWVSFHADGTVVLYPMQAENRRAERRAAVVDEVVRDTGFIVRRTLDFTRHESAGHFLEGTGSLVLDHEARVAYACRSLRTDERVAAEWAQALGYELELFTARDSSGALIYHTNVVMSVGTRFAAIALGNVEPADRARVEARLVASRRDVVALSDREMCAFAGNMLEVGSWDEHLGDFRMLVMSRTARQGLEPENFARLSASVDSVLAAPIDVIERHGGGSVRCMLAEVFLP